MISRHPLAPLTVDELSTIATILRDAGLLSPDDRVAWCSLDEPDKQFVYGWSGEPRRDALCALYNRDSRRTVLVGVSLDSLSVRHVRDQEGAHVQILNEEWLANGAAVRQDSRFARALAKRGITNLGSVVIEPWPAGHFGLPIDGTGRRLGRAVAYITENPGDNPYARPIENLVVILDRDTGEVIDIEEGDATPIPDDPGRLDVGVGQTPRELAPLTIEQPQGPGFTLIDGHVVWGPWQLRLSVHPIEGLVLSDIRVSDGETLRPVLFRASVCEMVVPYGSPGMNHWWKNAFDAGEAGLGKAVCSLQNGCDCLGEIVYMDAAFLDERGEPFIVEHAVCLHEEDYGVLWRHHDIATGKTDVRRSRRLVLSSFATIGNYDYGFFWYLYLDGTIEAQVKLTGMILTQAVPQGNPISCGNRVSSDLVGPNHQHLFSYRLDICVDGPLNSILEVEAARLKRGPENPHGNAFETVKRLLRSESEATRLASPLVSRSWLVINPARVNPSGEPVGYRLIPTHPATLLAQPDAAISKRAGFATWHLWVTRFDSEERRAAGDFPNQSPGGEGLPRWIAQNRSLIESDIVLWHTVGCTHFARPEDFPVMTCEYVGFILKPHGFFDRNPSLDLVPPMPHCHT